MADPIASPMKDAPESFGPAWTLGQRRVWIFFACGASQLRAGRGKWPWIAAVSMAALFTVGIPDGLNWCLRGVPWIATRTAGGNVALWFTSCLSFAILACAMVGWAIWARRGAWVDEMVDEDTSRKMARWLTRVYAFQWVGLIVASALLLLLFALVPKFGAFLPASALAWLVVAELIVIAGTVLYLSVLLPGLFSRIVEIGAERLKLYKYEPASTPGLRLMTDAIGLASSFLLIALVFATALWFYLRYSHDLLPDYMQSSLPLIAALIALLIVRVTMVPTIQLHWIILREKTRSLDELDRRIRQYPPNSGLFSRRREILRASLIDEFVHVARSENLPFRASAVVQFTAAVLGALVAFALVWAFGSPPH